MSDASFLREPSADAYQERIITVLDRALARAQNENVRIQTIEMHHKDMDELCDSLRERAHTQLWNPANCRGFTYDGIPVEANPTCERGTVYLVP